MVKSDKLTKAQKLIILAGKKAGIDISLYNKPCYDFAQMEEIFLGLKHGVDVHVYLDPKNDWQDMRRIRKKLESNNDLSVEKNK